MVLALICVLAGVLVSAGCLWVGFNKGVEATTKAYNHGIESTTRTGQHFVDTYVKKLTPEDITKLNNSTREEIPEENLRALDIDEDTYRKVMGWSEGRDKKGYGGSSLPNEEADY